MSTFATLSAFIWAFVSAFAFHAASAATGPAWSFTFDAASGAYRAVDTAGAIVAQADNAQSVGDRLFAIAKSGVVHFGPGVFVGQWTIEGADDLTIEGTPGQTTIACPNGWATCLIIGKRGATSTRNRRIAVRDIVFDVGGDSSSGGSAMILSACYGFDLENLSFVARRPLAPRTDGQVEYARTLNLTVWTKDQAPSEHGTVRHCRFEGTTLTCGGLKDVIFDDLAFTGDYRNSNTLIDVSFGEVGSAAMVENITFKNLSIDHVTGHYRSAQAGPVPSNTPETSPLAALVAGFQYVRNVTFDHASIDGAAQPVCALRFIAWPPGAPFIEQNVRLIDCRVTHVLDVCNVPGAVIR